NTAINNNIWQHVALTYDRSSSIARLFVNGISTASATFPAGIVPQTSGDLYFGFQPVPAPNFLGFNGSLDEFGLYNRALTPCEVQGIFNAGSNGKYGTNALSCPTSGTVEVIPPGLGPQFALFSAGPAWQTNKISFTTSGNGATPIIVAPRDPNVAVDNFV